ncbi:uncharacterized protein HaLaN_00731, partial [Haematococcus lacustris]
MKKRHKPAAAVGASAPAEEFDLARTLEALRAVREVDVNLKGLQQLQQSLRHPQQGPFRLSALVTQSPHLTELTNIWDTQLSARHTPTLVTLLTLLAEILRSATHLAPDSTSTRAVQPNDVADLDVADDKEAPPCGPAGADAGSNAAALPTLSKSQQAHILAVAAELVQYVLRSKLRSLYFALSSDTRHLNAAALALLTSLAAFSTTAAHDLTAAFDWSLSALMQLAKPPRDRSADGEPVPRAKYWKQWRAVSPLAQPTRALFVSFVLGRVDVLLLCAKLLPCRGLMSGLLHHLATDPPWVATRVLQLLAARVLGPDSSVPGPTRAQLFGDTALQQLASLAAALPLHSDPAHPASLEALPPSAALAAQAAYEVLLSLFTDPAQGMVTLPQSLDSPLVLSMGASDGQGDKSEQRMSTAGVTAYGETMVHGLKRVLRLLTRLRPADCLLHGRLLEQLASQQPQLAAEFLATAALSQEPKASARWAAHITLLSRLVTLLASSGPSHLVTRMEAATHAMQAAALQASLAEQQPNRHPAPLLRAGQDWGHEGPPGGALLLSPLQPPQLPQHPQGGLWGAAAPPSAGSAAVRA